ncbi:hypothetical protein IFM89_008158 [Coptis chinensis]|uniref:Uncharacterized protein n=1 Tax=Coptis chinensis TaxID=261450 RepID=A0A835M9F7_9MAGN|nr:hypothetical protein IFM89_008158 [Coptis chinensis]
MEELSESKDGMETPVIVVETVEAIEPVGEVVSVTEKVVLNPVKEVLKDIDEKILPQLNVRSVETSNGNGDPKEFHVTVSSDNQQKEVTVVPPTVYVTFLDDSSILLNRYSYPFSFAELLEEILESSGGLCLLWKSGVNISITDSTDNSITTLVNRGHPTAWVLGWAATSMAARTNLLEILAGIL